jgi:trehalose-phosphatase
MEYLFQSWEPHASRLRAASHILFLSDYDGTLAPIVSRPEEAILSTTVRDKLCALTQKPGFSVGIISGRPLSEVKTLTGIDDIYYAGNHGLEIEGPGFEFIHPVAEATKAELKRLARQFSLKLRDIAGSFMENKGFSLSIHYRLVKAGEEKRVEETVHYVISPLLRDGKIKLTSGKKVWEIRPPIDWDKGKASEMIRQDLKKINGSGQMLTIYLGDDTTDEDAFRVIHREDGLSVFIGGENSSSKASYFLNSTSEVEDFLSRLLELK